MTYKIITFFQIIVVIKDGKTKYLQRLASVMEKLKYKIKYNTSYYFRIHQIYMSITYIMDINNYYFTLSTDILWLLIYIDTNNNLC